MLCIFCMKEIAEGSDKCHHCGQSQSVSVPPHRLMPNTVLSGRYIVGAAKGEGGFGITYIGKDTRLDRIVAIKEYYPTGLVNRNSNVSAIVEQTQDENGSDAFIKGRDSFLTEAKTLAKFSGEMGIVEILDFFIENNTAYIVMEYLDGMSLSNKLKAEGTMTPEQALTVMMPVMISLEKVHKQGLIHRDISPSNIMILKNTVKLIDFGAARQASGEGNRSISLMLKPGYAPEEQYRSKGVQGPWTDVYALCATIYKCITGVTPEESNDRLHRDDLKTPSQLGVRVDPGFEAALMKGLSVLQENRYRSIEELLKDISPYAMSGGNNADGEQGQSAVQQDQSTRFVSVQQSAQRQPVHNGAFRQPAQMPQYQPQQYVQPPQQNAQPQQQYVQPQQQYVQPQQQYVQPQQQYVQPQQQYAQPQTSEIDRRVSEKVRKRKQKKAMFFVLIILGITAAVIIGLILFSKSGKHQEKKDGETLEAESFDPNDSKLNFELKDGYVSFYNTAVTPADISKIKSRKDVSMVTLYRCQIPQETMDVMWELDGSVTYLSIHQCTGFKDISPLSKLTTLTNLHVEECDLEGDVFKKLDLSKLENLTSFDISGNPKCKDISFVNTSKSITSLDISYCEVSDISAVKDLSKLYTFTANNCKISDISSLKGLSVRTVQLSGNSIKDISALEGNKNLSSLDLSSNEVGSVKPLENCTDLKYLNLNHNKLSDLKGLEKLIRLVKFECSHNSISELSGISNCTVLEVANLSSNKINDISLLSKSAASLKTVFFDDCGVSDMSCLSGASGLLALSFNNNSITSLDSIKGCTKLKAISGDNNKIKSLEPLADKTALRCISFAHNEISDMKPIERLSSGMKESMYVLDLSSNNISTLALTNSKTYEAVLVYSNPLKTLDNVKNIKGMNLAISYFDGIDLKELSKGYLRLSIVDCPLDKQMAIEKEVGRYSVTFCTAQEKEKDTQDKKDKVFKQINS